MFTALAVTAIFLADVATGSEPSTARWSLQVKPGRCSLERQGPGTVSAVAIDTTPGSDSYRLAIVGDVRGASASLAPASLTFAPSQQVTTGFVRAVKPSSTTPVLLMQGLPPSVLDGLSGASAVTVNVKAGGTMSVALIGTAKAVEALRKCSADQLVEWGADPAQFLPGGTMPIALKPRDDWISNSELLKLARQTRRPVVDDDFRLIVATDGRISECHALAEATESEFAKVACAAVMGRKLLNPARDASGNAVLGAVTFRVSLVRSPS
ncbi:hypothetical protein M9980_08155 [Sphingomonas donggukensis]|uniref:TonB C-terminal domain-containing protein n=1 Tax=Sphingomonas donggukensis TaxID=2949093 RepID=A0ABY4TQ77_9SPHN|nr:hypothetical protein [Sphingomonas donggukensis]URW74550.1 hypothetical protein M9980_08155 [Sphingomonas donggukensis]